MVEYKLDTIFHSLADPTRRDILERISKQELTVSEIAATYDMSLAAVSKHLKILENAELATRRREGKQFYVRAVLSKLKLAETYLHSYKLLWDARFDALEQFLKEEQNGKD